MNQKDFKKTINEILTEGKIEGKDIKNIDTLKYLLDGLEIENVLVSGTATNSNNSTESHAWNYVKLNDKWYAIDVTWDDPIIKGGGVLSDKLRYQYFLKGADNFLKNHNENGYLSQNSMKFEFPKLDNKDYNK